MGLSFLEHPSHIRSCSLLRETPFQKRRTPPNSGSLSSSLSHGIGTPQKVSGLRANPLIPYSTLIPFSDPAPSLPPTTSLKPEHPAGDKELGKCPQSLGETSTPWERGHAAAGGIRVQASRGLPAAPSEQPARPRPQGARSGQGGDYKSRRAPRASPPGVPDGERRR